MWVTILTMGFVMLAALSGWAAFSDWAGLGLAIDAVFVVSAIAAVIGIVRIASRKLNERWTKSFDD